MDYDGDGKKDLFSSRGNGIAVYRNTSTGNVLTFTDITPGTTLQTDYSGSNVNLYVLARDLPALDDIDGDGDIDVLTFVTSTQVEFHRNLSVETFGHRDSLIFELGDGCWGNFTESSSSNTIDLGVSCKTHSTGGPVQNAPQHSGSTLLTLDLDADQDRELIIGDFQSNWLTQLTNGGSLSSAHMTAQDPLFPSYSFSVDLSSFPAAFFVDVNFDGNRDLIVSPNLQNNAKNLNSVWFYENTATDSTPYFDLQQTDFLQDQMIDLGEGAVPILMDYNGDSLVDLFVASYGRYDAWATFTPLHRFFRNVGNATQPVFEEDTTISGDFGMQTLPDGQSPALGDLDGDGDVDLLIGHEEGEISFFENTAGVGVSPVFAYRGSNFENIDVGNYAAPALVDLDRDGLMDLVVGEQNGNLNYFRNTGSLGAPAFTQVSDSLGKVNVSPSGTFGQGFSVPRFFEVNGMWELMVGREAGTLLHYQNIDGNLGGPFALVDTFVAYADLGIRSAPAVAELNGDGWLDLVGGNYAGGVSLWLGIDPAVGREEEVLEERIKLKVWPNPVGEVLYVELGGKSRTNVEWKILDLFGRCLLRGEGAGKRLTINLESVSDGLYVVEVKRENLEGRRVKIMKK